VGNFRDVSLPQFPAPGGFAFNLFYLCSVYLPLSTFSFFQFIQIHITNLFGIDTSGVGREFYGCGMAIVGYGMIYGAISNLVTEMRASENLIEINVVAIFGGCRRNY